MRNLFRDFKKFITRGNVLDMAIGVIIGSAFSAITSALVNKILYPLLSLLGTGNFDTWSTVLKPAVLAEDGITVITPAVIIDWGAFVSAIVNFLLIAVVLFIIVRVFAAAQKNMDIRRAVQEKLDQDIPLNEVEKRLLARWEKRDPATAPKKTVAPPPPPPPAPTATEALLAEILSELKKGK